LYEFSIVRIIGTFSLFADLLLVPGIADISAERGKFQNPVSPESLTLGLTGFGALILMDFVRTF